MIFPSTYQHILDHYEHRWRKPTRIYTFDGPQVPANVRPLYVVEFSLPIDRLTIYASISMSKAPMLSSESLVDHRCEIYLGTFQAFAGLPEMIAMLAAYHHIGKTFIDVEHTVPLGDPIVPQSKMSDVIFIAPYFDPPDFRYIEEENYHVQMLWIIPLHKSEKEFKMKRGWPALKKIFEGKHVVIGDLLRGPII